MSNNQHAAQTTINVWETLNETSDTHKHQLMLRCPLRHLGPLLLRRICEKYIFLSLFFFLLLFFVGVGSSLASAWSGERSLPRAVICAPLALTVSTLPDVVFDVLQDP